MKRTIKSVAAALALGVTATAANAGVIFEDDFNSYAEGTYTSSIGSTWNVTHGSIDVVAPGGIWESLNQPGHGGFLDLDGSTGESGRITSADRFLFEAGVTYNLTFDLAGDQRNDGLNRTRTFATTIDGVSGNPLLNSLITLDSNESFDTFSYSFVGTGYLGRIGFSARGGNNDDDNIGLLLDNVVLESVEVSEPGTLALLGLSLFGLGLARRKTA